MDTIYEDPATMPPGSLDPSAAAALHQKITRKIVPFLFLAFGVAYIDRVNVSFAKLQMLSQLSLSETAYGLGAGIFFLGYFIFEVPSNLILHRVGARIWIARIMVTWAIVSFATAFVTGATSFYVMRFLLGVAEAGFFPGVILYLTYWFGAARRSQIIALFMAAIPVSAIIGGPVSGWIMHGLDGASGLAGWKWLFMIEGLGSLLIGIMAFFVLHDRPASANWLTAREKALIASELQRDEQLRVSHSLRETLGSGRVWLLGLVYFCIAMGNYGLVFWVPTVIHSAGIQDVANIGLLSAIPSIAGAIAMILIGRRADRRSSHRLSIVVCSVVGAAALCASVFSVHQFVLSMLALIIASVAINSLAPVFWSIPTALLGGAGAAAGIALVNCTGNLAGFVSPFVVGWLKDQTGDLLPGMIALACALVAGAVLVLLLPRQWSRA